MSTVITTDILVVGAGNAGLCAAISAKEKGASVIILEKASKSQRGGNSALTMNMRFAYNNAEDLIEITGEQFRKELEDICEKFPRYSEEEFFEDLMLVTEGNSDPILARKLVEDSFPTIKWLQSIGHEWELKPHFSPKSVPIRLKGGGKRLQEHNFMVAENLGINVMYETAATSLIVGPSGGIKGVIANQPENKLEIHAKAVILSSGGFESSKEMRRKHLGEKWGNVHPRGVPFNTGDGLRMALEIGAQPYGSWSTCHASAQDVSLPTYTLPENVSVCRSLWRYSFPFGITVNKNGKRFFNEGENFGSLIYAKVGRQVLEQPGGIAYQVFDIKALKKGLIDPSYFKDESTIFASETLDDLARDIGVDPEEFCNTITNYNQACSNKDINPIILDGNSTVGIHPPKSNWALPINNPPYIAFPITCGITFTFGGVKVDHDSRVLDRDNQPIEGLYAAGEMVGGLFHLNYPGGSGMMSGSVFGRTAGNSAIEYVNHVKIEKEHKINI